MNIVVALLAAVVVVLVLELVRLRRRVAQLEKARVVVDRHMQHLAWRLDGERGPEPSDQHVVFTVHEHADRHGD